MKKFPEFWFEGNLFFNDVKSIKDLKHLFENYKDTMSINEILDEAREAEGSSYIKYGLRTECNGKKTLRQFLEENEFNVPVCPEKVTIKYYIDLLSITNE